jgi:hypothetical protein
MSYEMMHEKQRLRRVEAIPQEEIAIDNSYLYGELCISSSLNGNEPFVKALLSGCAAIWL